VELAVALSIFVVSHVAIARTGLKPSLIKRLGERAYLIGYSLLSIALLGWVIAALLRTPKVFLWETPDWAYGFALVTTGLGFALLGAGGLSPNPLSVSFRKSGFDPARPGLIGWVRHPIIYGFGFWGAAHIPANGDVAALCLFGGALVFAVIGARAVETRLRKRLGAKDWARLTAGAGNIDAHAVTGAALGLALWAALLYAHPLLFGVDPLATLFARC
jgi:uncharacterized membrane protein